MLSCIAKTEKVDKRLAHSFKPVESITTKKVITLAGVLFIFAGGAGVAIALGVTGLTHYYGNVQLPPWILGPIGTIGSWLPQYLGLWLLGGAGVVTAVVVGFSGWQLHKTRNRPKVEASKSRGEPITSNPSVSVDSSRILDNSKATKERTEEPTRKPETREKGAKEKGAKEKRVKKSAKRPKTREKGAEEINDGAGEHLSERMIKIPKENKKEVEIEVEMVPEVEEVTIEKVIIEKKPSLDHYSRTFFYDYEKSLALGAYAIAKLDLNKYNLDLVTLKQQIGEGQFLYKRQQSTDPGTEHCIFLYDEGRLKFRKMQLLEKRDLKAFQQSSQQQVKRLLEARFLPSPHSDKLREGDKTKEREKVTEEERVGAEEKRDKKSTKRSETVEGNSKKKRAEKPEGRPETTDGRAKKKRVKKSRRPTIETVTMERVIIEKKPSLDYYSGTFFHDYEKSLTLGGFAKLDLNKYNLDLATLKQQLGEGQFLYKQQQSTDLWTEHCIFLYDEGRLKFRKMQFLEMRDLKAFQQSSQQQLKRLLEAGFLPSPHSDKLPEGDKTEERERVTEQEKVAEESDPQLDRRSRVYFRKCENSLDSDFGGFVRLDLGEYNLDFDKLNEQIGRGQFLFKRLPSTDVRPEKHCYFLYNEGRLIFREMNDLKGSQEQLNKLLKAGFRASPYSSPYSSLLPGDKREGVTKKQKGVPSLSKLNPEIQKSFVPFHPEDFSKIGCSSEVDKWHLEPGHYFSVSPYLPTHQPHCCIILNDNGELKWSDFQILAWSLNVRKELRKVGFVSPTLPKEMDSIFSSLVDCNRNNRRVYEYLYNRKQYNKYKKIMKNDHYVILSFPTQRGKYDPSLDNTAEGNGKTYVAFIKFYNQFYCYDRAFSKQEKADVKAMLKKANFVPHKKDKT
jgi:hypothetical protein